MIAQIPYAGIATLTYDFLLEQKAWTFRTVAILVSVLDAALKADQF